jgi:hypothetical protein
MTQAFTGLNRPYLVGTSLGNSTEIGNIYGTAKARLVRGIKDGIQRNVLENLVDSQLVWIEQHLE